MPFDGSRGRDRCRHPRRPLTTRLTRTAGRDRAAQGGFTRRECAPTVRVTSYAPPPPGHDGVPQPHPQGTAVLALGIIGLIACGILAPVAWVMGSNALREIDRNPSAYSNRGTVQAGMVLGIVGTILWILGIILTVTLS